MEVKRKWCSESIKMQIVCSEVKVKMSVKCPNCLMLKCKLKGDRSILFSMFSSLAESSISIDFYAFYAESQGSVSKDLCLAEFILVGGESTLTMRTEMRRILRTKRKKIKKTKKEIQILEQT